jgi:hypothetical protein
VRRELIVISALLFLGKPPLVLADSAPRQSCPPQRTSANADALPLAATAYPSTQAAAVLVPVVRAEADRGGMPARNLEGGPSGLWLGGGSSSSRHKYLPVLLSLLVPGAGEIYTGHYVRGAALLAAEVSAWTGYVYYHGKGLDSRDAYERFADAHWDYDKWILDHPATQGLSAEDRDFAALDSIGRNDWTDLWPGYHTWHSKEEEKQNYYETIGKYDWFISGWEDWDPDAEPWAHDTGLRTTYRSMRRASNEQMDKADKFIYLSIAARVVSLVEMVLLTRDGSYSSAEGAAQGFSVKTRATGIASGEIALVYRFR